MASSLKRTLLPCFVLFLLFLAFAVATVFAQIDSQGNPTDAKPNPDTLARIGFPLYPEKKVLERNETIEGLEGANRTPLPASSNARTEAKDHANGYIVELF